MPKSCYPNMPLGYLVQNSIIIKEKKNTFFYVWEYVTNFLLKFKIKQFILFGNKQIFLFHYNLLSIFPTILQTLFGQRFATKLIVT